ncbi:MAG: hypothetical protein KatS3mg031_0773 [Chitinophagales bacterium]|nr:MAG: hypothetical protein KatS3mg031_0773 [Chitinophagales bacterium]
MPVFAVSGQTFEGVIEFSSYLSQTKDQSTVTWYTLNGNSRFEISGVADGKPYQSVLLFKKNDPNIYLLTRIGNENAVYTIPQSALTPEEQLIGSVAVKLPETKTIAGKQCYRIKLESSEQTTYCWITDELRMEEGSLPQVLRSKGIIAALSAAGYNGLPLEVEARNDKGEVVFSYSVKNIRKMTPDTSLFTVPADYGDGTELFLKSIKAE